MKNHVENQIAENLRHLVTNVRENRIQGQEQLNDLAKEAMKNRVENRKIQGQPAARPDKDLVKEAMEDHQ
jgi:hypothetical protein